MRVVQVVTVASPDGSFGGPLRVATNLGAELAARGHDVVLAAGHRGYDDVPRSLGGIPARLFDVRRVVPVPGFAGLGSPGMMRWFRSISRDVDLVHVHLARDLVTLPLARYTIASGIPLVAQTHGMIRPRRDLPARVVDSTLTRSVLARADAVTFLTAHERDHLIEVSRTRARLYELRNGIHVAPESIERAPSGDRPAPEALFLGRLHPRKRAPVFVDAAMRLLDAGVSARFAIVGPDEGDLAEILRTVEGSPHRAAFSVEGALDPDATGQRMARADVFVLPSVDEPYPMAVLEAMATGLPVIVTDSCGLSHSVAQGGGIVTSSSVESLTEAMHRLLVDVDERLLLGRAARAIAIRDHDIGAVTTTLEGIYDQAVAGRRSW